MSDLPSTDRRLLVVCDFDGTLAPEVDDPRMAAPLPRAVEALGRLAQLPRTAAAIVTGRSLWSLFAVLDPPEGVHLIGSHGLEDPDEPLAGPHRRERDLLAQLVEVARALPHRLIEERPFTLAFHADDPHAVDCFTAYASQLPGVSVRHSPRLVEASVRGCDKGEAIDRLRARTGAETLVYLGNDIDDAALDRHTRAGDLTIRVVSLERAERRRNHGSVMWLNDAEDVANYLEALDRARAGVLYHHAAR